MSVDHSIEFGEDLWNQCVFNFSRINEDERDAEQIHGTLSAYSKENGEPRFTCKLSIAELRALHEHLGRYSVITDHNNTRTGKFIEVRPDAEEISSLLSLADHRELLPVLRDLFTKRLSKADTNIILGRKDALKNYADLLADSTVSETKWQHFFCENDWIFGYGLRYCFLKILQREARVSSSDLSGRDTVISDFLLSDLRFTKLVEIKRPDTPLFESSKNRSRSWRLSSELTEAVSQILAQKAHWEIESQTSNFTKDGGLIKEETVDVDCILIIGNHNDVTGTDQEAQTKRRTLELYRRNLRNLEIITYDELHARASFIVTGSV